MHAMTAAHLSLPFDTMVRVTNLANGRSVDLRINDRGPFLKERVIDVSRAAGERLGLIATGTARVTVEVIAAPGRDAANRPSAPPAAPPETAPVVTSACGGSLVGVQVGSFRDPDNAERTFEEIASRYADARIIVGQTATGTLHRVVIGAQDSASARKMLERLEDEGLDGFVTRIEPDAACLAANPS
jgi:rare lipoprotein A